MSNYQYTNRNVFRNVQIDRPASFILHTSTQKKNCAHKTMYPNISNICGVLKETIDAILCVTALKHYDGHICRATQYTTIKIMNVAKYMNSA